MANVLHPKYRELERDVVSDPEVEYKERIDRVKSVCDEWNKSGWYKDNILPEGRYFTTKK